MVLHRDVVELAFRIFVWGSCCAERCGGGDGRGRETGLSGVAAEERV